MGSGQHSSEIPGTMFSNLIRGSEFPISEPRIWRRIPHETIRDADPSLDPGGAFRAMLEPTSRVQAAGEEATSKFFATTPPAIQAELAAAEDAA